MLSAYQRRRYRAIRTCGASPRLRDSHIRSAWESGGAPLVRRAIRAEVREQLGRRATNFAELVYLRDLAVFETSRLTADWLARLVSESAPGESESWSPSPTRA